MRDLVLVNQPRRVVIAEGLNGVPAFEVAEAQLHQGAAGEHEARMEGVANDAVDAEVHQRVGVLAVARAGEDRELGEVPAHRPRRRERALDILDRQDEEYGLVGLRGAQQLHPARVAVVDLVAESAHEIDLLCTGL